MRRSVVADTCVEGSIYRLNALKQGSVGKIYGSTFLAISGALCSTKHADAKKTRAYMFGKHSRKT